MLLRAHRRQRRELGGPWPGRLAPGAAAGRTGAEELFLEGPAARGRAVVRQIGRRVLWRLLVLLLLLCCGTAVQTAAVWTRGEATARLRLASSRQFQNTALGRDSGQRHRHQGKGLPGGGGVVVVDSARWVLLFQKPKFKWGTKSNPSCVLGSVRTLSCKYGQVRATD